MAKAKFERTKPHCNIGTIGHVDQETQQSTLKISIKLQKRENVVSQFLQLTLSTERKDVTTLTLTAQDMPITLKT